MYFALFLCFSIISNSNGDAIVNIFGSAALAEFGEENTKYFYTNQYIYAFNVSEDYFNTYKREHCHPCGVPYVQRYIVSCRY